MVRIPLLRRRPKPDSPQGEGGKKTSLPASPPDKDGPAQQFVLGTNKKIPFPVKPPGGHEVMQPPKAAVIEKTSIPVTLPDEDATANAPETASVEETVSPEPLPDKLQPEPLSGAGTTQGNADALAILRAMPDYIFRIGRDGIFPVVGDGSHDGAGSASRGTGVDGSPDGQAVASEKDKPRPLEKIILEELARQSQQHTKKVLETRQLETFEFQVRDDKEVHHLEVRLTAFGQSEVLAVVRDVTVLRQTHNALIESRNELENHLKDRNAELIRVNKMLKTEVELRVEQEEILKKNFHRLERLLEDTIGAITLIVERRDPHVADHQRRVSQLACSIAQEMKLRSDQMRAIRMAAQLHDLGKIFIPAEILRKPGKLTEAEMSVVRTHPDTDYQILKRIDFPISIADIVRQHHERMNGSGYPQGLKGDDILAEARILGVADVIEGMVFERPYRIAPGLEAALKEITDQKGVLYDPAVVDSCLKLFAEERFKFEPLPGQETAGSGGEPRRESHFSGGQAPDHRDF